MSLKIYNTQKRIKENFEPLHPPQVKMYVCGITAYDYCHLGHARASVVFDVVYRTLLHLGYQVEYIRNFTDIDDKIIKRAQETGKNWKEVAETFITAFLEDMQALGNLRPNAEPRATEYIEAMQKMIAQLVEKGVAYPSGGDVFFSIKNFPAYGQLAQKNLEELEAGARIEIDEDKHNPLDFALWKGAKPGEPEWDSPWGAGRPGWHIECSAMSTSILGPSLDIHGGGRDLIFPHHENEKAQAEAALDKPFVKYWLHNGFVNLNADKMSKSTGNFLSIRDILAQYPREAIRYFLLSAHYRSPLDFNDGNIQEAQAATDRVYQTLLRLEEYAAKPKVSANSEDIQALLQKLKAFPQRVTEALEDDFNSAVVLGVCFETVRELNKFLDSNPDAASVEAVKKLSREAFSLVQSCMGLFGQDPKDYEEERRRRAMKNLPFSEAEILQKLAERKAARQNRDFKLSDQIRDDLAAKGILLKDNPDGTTNWSVA